MYCQVDDQAPQNNRAQPGSSQRTKPIHICILGGGFGGLYTALHLQRFSQLKSSHYRITLIEQREQFLFTPLLYEVVTGELQPWEIAPPYQTLLTNSTVQFRQEVVEAVDLKQRLVRLQDGEVLPYDYLVLAVGGETRLDSVPGAAEYAQSFRTLADAEHLKEKLRFLSASDRTMIRVAIAGAGPNGVELACKLADHLKQRGHIRLIDRGDEILKSFSSGSRIAAYRALAKRGVELMLETSIAAIDATSITLSRQGQFQEIKTDLVLWTAGTQTLEWVRQLDCAHNSQGQVLTLPTLQLLDYPHVFALGDLAAMQDAKGVQVPATAQAVYQQAPQAARNIWATLTGRPIRRFRYQHLGEMLTLGTNAAVVSSFGITLQGHLARIIRRGVYVQRLPTLKHRLKVVLRWFANSIVKRLPRLIQQRLRRIWYQWMHRRPKPIPYPRRFPR